MKLRRLFYLLVLQLSYNYLQVNSETQATTVSITLSELSGHHAVCQDEKALIYSCVTSGNGAYALIWKVIRSTATSTLHFNSNDTTPYSEVKASAVATLLKTRREANNISMESQLVVSHAASDPDYQTTIQCTATPGGQQENHTYLIAGSPKSPSSIWISANRPERYAKIYWNNSDDMDYNTILIRVNAKDLLTVGSNVTEHVIVDLSEYSAQDSILIEAYGINECNNVSSTPAKFTFQIKRKNSTTITDSCDKKLYTAIGASIAVTMLVVLAIICVIFCCIKLAVACYRPRHSAEPRE